MKPSPRVFLWFIVLLTVFAALIVFPKTKPFRIVTPKLPGINRQITIVLPFAGSTIGNKEYSFKEGLDLAGGTSITLTADMASIKKEQRDNALESAKLVLERRVNLFGVSEPVVQTAKVNNDYRLIVDLPGINVRQAVALIGTTAQLSFWEQGASGSGRLRNPAIVPFGILETFGTDAQQTDLTGKDLKDAVVSFDSTTAKPQVQLLFTNEGTKKFADITTRNVSKVVAIVLDNQVIEAPVVREQILTGSAVISGSFTPETAKQLAIALRAGALPVPLMPLQQISVGATLGQDALAKSVFAGIVGFLAIIIFMVALYRSSGVVASIALILYSLFVLAIFKLIPVVLTLAGIAGFVLSIGMAVDANILIFERTKEERRAGRSISQSCSLGFKRAWPSIRDSNISTIITCFILYQFGSGIVRGFALTLAIGVIVSMFSAIVITRTLLRITNYEYHC